MGKANHWDDEDRAAWNDWRRKRDAHPAYKAWRRHWSNKMTAAEVRRIIDADPAKARQFDAAFQRMRAGLGELYGPPNILGRLFERVFPGVKWTGSDDQHACLCAFAARSAGGDAESTADMIMPRIREAIYATHASINTGRRVRNGSSKGGTNKRTNHEAMRRRWDEIRREHQEWSATAIDQYVAEQFKVTARTVRNARKK